MSRALPILFNTDMVRAILDGRKTVTRRTVKSKQYMGLGEKDPLECLENVIHRYANMSDVDVINMNYKPPYQPGDIMYVRETIWQKTCHYLDVDGETKGVFLNEFRYAATDEEPEVGWDYSWAKRPSIHMPKEAARIWIKVTDVRVERLHDITEEQAKREGIQGYTKDGKLYKYAVTDDWWIAFHYKRRKAFAGNWWQDMPRTAKEAFSYLWNSTLKNSDLARYGWNASPWVWVIEFERCEEPEGA